MTIQEETEKLISLIKQGSIANVVMFGKEKLQIPVPYVVIIPTQPNGMQRVFDISIHFEIGKDNDVHNYLYLELPDLVMREKDFCMSPYFKPYGNVSPIAIDTTDNTLKASRQFWTTVILSRT